MAQVGGAYVRIRPTLGREEAEALRDLAAMSRALADGLDAFLAKFPTRPALEEEPHHD